MKQNHSHHHTTVPIIPLLLDTAEPLAKHLDAELKRQYAIGVSQHRILRALAERQRVTQKTIASALDQTESSISRQMDVLRDGHLVTIHRNPADRRERIIVLTPKGRDMLCDMDETIADVSATMLPEAAALQFAHHLVGLKRRLSPGS